MEDIYNGDNSLTLELFSVYRCLQKRGAELLQSAASIKEEGGEGMVLDGVLESAADLLLVDNNSSICGPGVEDGDLCSKHIHYSDIESKGKGKCTKKEQGEEKTTTPEHTRPKEEKTADDRQQRRRGPSTQVPDFSQNGRQPQLGEGKTGGKDTKNTFEKNKQINTREGTGGPGGEVQEEEQEAEEEDRERARGARGGGENGGNWKTKAGVVAEKRKDTNISKSLSSNTGKRLKNELN